MQLSSYNATLHQCASVGAADVMTDYRHSPDIDADGGDLECDNRFGRTQIHSHEAW
jgi:hypothetical protein